MGAEWAGRGEEGEGNGVRITTRTRESVPDHDPDPGRTATLSTHTEQMPCKNHSAINSIMLAFGGGLCSLSTSRFLCDLSDITFDVTLQWVGRW